MSEFNQDKNTALIWYIGNFQITELLRWLIQELVKLFIAKEKTALNMMKAHWSCNARVHVNSDCQEQHVEYITYWATVLEDMGLIV